MRRTCILPCLRSGLALEFPSSEAWLRRRHTSKRAGLSLLEVLAALVIFMFSLVAINQIVDSGSRTALRSQRLSRAAMFGESVMSEIIAGVQPLQSVDLATLPGAEPGWYYSVTTTPEEWSNVPLAGQTVQGLHTVYVTVTWSGKARDDVEYTLSRLVLDPQLRLDDTDNTSSTTSDSSSSTNNASSSTSSNSSNSSLPTSNTSSSPSLPNNLTTNSNRPASGNSSIPVPTSK